MRKLRAPGQKSARVNLLWQGGHGSFYNLYKMCAQTGVEVIRWGGSNDPTWHSHSPPISERNCSLSEFEGSLEVLETIPFPALPRRKLRPREGIGVAQDHTASVSRGGARIQVSQCGICAPPPTSLLHPERGWGLC